MLKLQKHLPLGNHNCQVILHLINNASTKYLCDGEQVEL